MFSLTLKAFKTFTFFISLLCFTEALADEGYEFIFDAQERITTSDLERIGRSMSYPGSEQDSVELRFIQGKTEKTFNRLLAIRIRHIANNFLLKPVYEIDEKTKEPKLVKFYIYAGVRDLNHDYEINYELYAEFNPGNSEAVKEHFIKMQELQAEAQESFGRFFSSNTDEIVEDAKDGELNPAHYISNAIQSDQKLSDLIVELTTDFSGPAFYYFLRNQQVQGMSSSEVLGHLFKDSMGVALRALYFVGSTGFMMYMLYDVATDLLSEQLNYTDLLNKTVILSDKAVHVLSIINFALSFKVTPWRTQNMINLRIGFSALFKRVFQRGLDTSVKTALDVRANGVDWLRRHRHRWFSRSKGDKLQCVDLLR